MSIKYTHGRLITVLLAICSFSIAFYIFKHEETKYSIVSWLDVSRPGEPVPPTPPKPDSSDEEGQPSFNQRKSDRQHMEDLTNYAANRLGGLATPGELTPEEKFAANEVWQKVPEGHILQPGVEYRVNPTNGRIEARKNTAETSGAETSKATVDSTTQTPPLSGQIEAPSTANPTPAPEMVKPYPFPIPSQQAPQQQTEPQQPLALPAAPIKLTPVLDPSGSETPSPASEIALQELSPAEKEMKSMIDRYRSPNATIGSKFTLLQTLQSDVHDEENGNAFVDLNGHQVLMKDWNNQDKYVRAMVSLTLGTLARNAPHLKSDLMDDGCLTGVMNLLHDEPEFIVWLPSLFLLKTMLQRFPDAQKEFVKRNGIGLLSQVFNYVDEDSQKLQMRVLDILSDMKIERNAVKETVQKMADQKIDEKTPFMAMMQDRLRAYESIPLSKQVKDNQYCEEVIAYYPELNLVLKSKLVHWYQLYRDECSAHIPAVRLLIKTLSKDIEEALKIETDEVKQAGLKTALQDINLLNQ